MRYVTSVERMAKQEGFLEEAQLTVKENLEAHLGPIPDALRTAIDAVDNLERLRSLRRAALNVASFEAFWRLMDE